MTDAPLLAWPRVAVNGSHHREVRCIHTHRCAALRRADHTRAASTQSLRDLSVCARCSGEYDPSEVEQDNSRHRALHKAAPDGGER
jgi:hypothetical protein